METSKSHNRITQYMMHLSGEELTELVKSYQRLQETGQFWDTKFQRFGEKIADELGVLYDIHLSVSYLQEEVFRRYLLLVDTLQA